MTLLLALELLDTRTPDQRPGDFPSSPVDQVAWLHRLAGRIVDTVIAPPPLEDVTIAARAFWERDEQPEKRRETEREESSYGFCCGTSESLLCQDPYA